jgi:F0F1-type ATP synthase assembly protein I
MPERKERPLFWLSKYLSLALTLPASVAGGYIFGAFFDKWLHLPVLRVVGILLGMAAGIFQITKELFREAGGKSPRDQ